MYHVVGKWDFIDVGQGKKAGIRAAPHVPDSLPLVRGPRNHGGVVDVASRKVARLFFKMN